MSLLIALLIQVVHIALVLLAAPTLAGVLGWLSDRVAGRDGAPVMQPWRDLARLLRKQPVLADNASVLVRAAPLVSLTLAALCAALVPSFSLGMALAPLADTLTIAGLLALGRVVLTLAAMDAGTGEGGLAASNATSLAVLAEPALLLGFVALSLLAGTGNLDLMIDVLRDGYRPAGPAVAVAITALAILGWAETVTRPLDRAFSARDLASVRMAEDLRRLVWFGLIATLACPAGIAAAEGGPVDWMVGLVTWGARLLLAAAAMAGLRLLIGSGHPRGVPAVLGVAALLGVLAVALTLAKMGPA